MSQLTKSKLQAAARWCVDNSDTILQVLIFAAAFLKAIAESDRHPKR
jgi:hypothetical protein